MASVVRLKDGTYDFSGGIDSGRVSTVQSAVNPHGLPRTMLAWMTNATVRGGGILQRTGWTKLCTVQPGTALYQGGFLYEPSFALPYLMLSIGGRIIRVRVDTDNSVQDLSAVSGLTNPANVARAFFVQGEQFMVIQAGDLALANPPTLPLFWDGATLRRSVGLAASTPGFTPSTYNLVTTVGFLVPAVSRTGVMTFSGPYPGAQGDVVTSDVGTFLVTFKGGNTATLQTISSSFAGTGTVAPGPIAFTTQELKLVHTVTLASDWVIPAAGLSVVVTLSAPYPGTLNDVVTWAVAGSGTGDAVYQVTGISGNTVTLLTLSVASGFAGGTWHAADSPFIFLATPPQSAAPVSEMPAATAMCYYQGRIWYAQGRIYTAGDIVGGPSGTLAYRFKDAVLKVTENPLAIGGDGFTVPDISGDIRALSYSANLDTSLGQGPLYVFTPRQVYQLVVPTTRQDWIAAGSNNQPVQTVAQRKYGAVSDRCVVPVNGDLFYQSLEPAIRSLFVSIRYFQQWGNVPISRNINRVLKFNDRALMSFATGIEFDNRLWQAVLPKQTPVGVAFQAIAPLDFDIISSFGEEEAKPPPAWEGILEGLDILQLFEGDFGGRQRAFAAVHSREEGSIDVYEFTDFAKTDTNNHGEARVPWRFETPAYTFNRELELKQLDGGEVWIDKIAGTVEMEFEYRVDADPCWQPWFKTQFCAAKSSCEDVNNPVCYPLTPYCEGYRFPITLPSPQPGTCGTLNKRPTNQGYQFQLRVKIKGWCRVRGFLLFALPVDRQPFQGLND